MSCEKTMEISPDAIIFNSILLDFSVKIRLRYDREIK